MQVFLGLLHCFLLVLLFRLSASNFLLFHNSLSIYSSKNTKEWLHRLFRELLGSIIEEFAESKNATKKRHLLGERFRVILPRSRFETKQININFILWIWDDELFIVYAQINQKEKYFVSQWEFLWCHKGNCLNS